ncbi:uncharacterized protein Z520_03053 [Fonsecaea multimorphosa CBS 102226]|uniref:Uncharacterized protein n=1 Tax=Fonsecaea multimorphosa CBS 102226 TaxID=1442371 RepID=A0A0D2HHX6_9EURO|nr:uncharacterized protein Z520_03053 [Fonsecaea multimorphosa CBS 102226]KIY01501.1 hypothetical protein Z520_03053 [Fonsecaea multimorphosa CBS 102226]OAL28262.1 hypothetical protein AYO22_02968 [Fonsecaea multimorphosa]
MEERHVLPPQPTLGSASADMGTSTVSSMSRLWRSNQSSNSAAASPNPAAKTFVVPLFLATSRRSARNDMFARGALPASTRSRTSTRSVIESAPSGAVEAPPLSVRRDDEDEQSDMYAGSLRDQPSVVESIEPIPLARNMDDEPTPSERQAMRSYRNGSSTSGSSRSSKRRKTKYGIFSRKSYRDPDVNAKARISFAFGVTLLVAVVIYLVLGTTTSVGRNTMFHVLSILLILTLTGIFIHQLLRMCMLMRRPRRSRHRTAHGTRRRHLAGQTGGRRDRRERQNGRTEDLILEKPIQIHMSTDTGFSPDVENAAPIRVPPPVYGNTRTSMRLNPDLVHWKEVQIPPTPLTPTYEEALNQVHQTVGYRPPSYLSESGTTVALENRARDVDAALENIHPLERERMRTLTAAALEGSDADHV